MKAVVCERYGPPEVLKLVTVEKPIPNDNEVLIKIHASTVNSGDVRVRGLAVEGFLRFIMRMVLGFNKPRKPILGMVFSGRIESIGKHVTLFKVGDEVFGTMGMKFGAYAEYATLSEKSVMILKPHNASHEKAAAIVFGGMSAIYFLEKAGIKNSSIQKRVLIYGATGAVGSSAIQIAKEYQAHVTSVCSTSGKELAYKLGSDHVIDYTLNDLTNHSEQYDIVFDAVGKLDKKRAQSFLKSQGRYLTVGGLDVASETLEQLTFLKQLFEQHKLDPVIDKMFRLDDIVEAHRYVDTGRKKGNVVITYG